MTILTAPLHDHHKHCDGLFADAEAAVAAADWPTASNLLASFLSQVEAHFHTEETILFPAFETATGMAMGPTQMMRHEHAQMRELMAQMQSALQQRDQSGFAGAAETLLIMMQQHNMKEENILYPMCDRSLANQAENLTDRLQESLRSSVE
jgi:hemerythrin-like domain-containing protein